MRHQVAGNLQALLHAARVGGWQVVNAAGVEFHALHPTGGLAAQITVVASAQGHQAFAHIGTARHVHAQAIAGMLFNKTPIGARQPAQARL